jgi:hypothetical protein
MIAAADPLAELGLAPQQIRRIRAIGSVPQDEIFRLMDSAKGTMFDPGEVVDVVLGLRDDIEFDDDDDLVQTVPLCMLIPSPENAALYRERTVENADFKRLVESIEKDGIKAPLLVSIDRFIVSGHQRRSAAKEAGLKTVPVIVLDLRRSDHTADEWTQILREHNCGRDKTLDERIRENIVDVNPDDALTAVVDEQVKRARPKSKTIWVPDEKKTRSEITDRTRDFAEAIKSILTGTLKNSLPVPERSLHYHLAQNLRPRTSRGKNGFVYGNDERSVKALSDMLTRLRLCGEVPWDWISDETRPVATWQIWRDAAEFLKEQTDDLYGGFARNLMQSQSAYYEIIIEKLTCKGFIDKVAARYTIPTMTMRGNSSIDARHRVRERFKASGKKSLVLFFLVDCDPAGDMIAESTVHSLRDEFGIDLKAVRVAMTHAIADQYHLAESVEEKKKSKGGLKVKESSVKKKFIERHGRGDYYELEAVVPEVLSDCLDREIRANIDIEAYNHEVQQQAIDVAKIRATRKATLETIRPGPETDAGGEIRTSPETGREDAE